MIGRARRHSVAATASALPILALTLVQVRAYLGTDVAFWAEVVHAYAPPIAAAMGLGLALFLAWRVPERREVRMLNWVLVFFALNTALASWPFDSGWLAAAWVRIATAFWPMLWIRFTMVFPRELTVADVDEMASSSRPPGWLGRVSAGVHGTLRYVIAHPWTWYAWAGVWMAQFLASLYAGAMEYRPGVGFIEMPSPTPLEDPVLSPVLVRVAGSLCLLVTVIVSASFLWVGYRASDSRARGRILWVVLASIFIAAWVLGFQAFNISTRLTSAELIFDLTSAYATLLYPVLWMVGLAGLAASVLFSGAFDLRPVVRTTGVYAMLFVIVTFLFAGLEELLEAQLASRFGVEGMGLWISAGTLALVIGPIRDKLDQLVDQAGLKKTPRPDDVGEADHA